MEGIRAFEAGDIPQVAILHQQVFGIPSSPDIRDRYTAYFTDKFLKPALTGALPSLVFESGGEVLGFIAVGTRPFVAGRKPIRAAVSSQFVVHPQARSRLIAVALLRAFLAGPQELSFTDEANETSRKLWEKLGGSTASLYSTHWIAPLRPAKLLLPKIALRMRNFARLASPLAPLMDSIAWQIIARLKLPSGCDLQVEELDAPRLAEIMSKATSDAVQLRPEYDVDSLKRLIDDANQPILNGNLQRILLRAKNGEPAGWFLYYLNGQGIAEVLQVGFRDNHQVEIANQLFTHAHRSGASALSGRLEPHLAKAISGQHCLLFRREHTMLVHSRDPRILNAIHFGKAFISRLEGEWCLRFH